jgi:hypothetical protein
LDRRISIYLMAAWAMLAPPALSADDAAAPLVLEATIALPETRGRIDHLAVDLGRRRLFVAEFRNGSVDVVDLAKGAVVKRITGLDEPQGVAFAPQAGILAVANGGDGTVRLYDGAGLAPRGAIRLDDDADNVRLDPRSGNLVVGYGGAGLGHGRGGLAVIDPARAMVVKTVALPAHPEGFQLAGARAYVNVPDERAIAVLDLASGGPATLRTRPLMAWNFPMALGEGGSIAVAFRSPATLALFDGASGRLVGQAASCGDADDVFFDARRRRYYLSCGSGAIDVFAASDGALRRAGRVATLQGARTSLYVPELDRLFLALRARPFADEPAAIRIYRSAP